MKKILDEVLSSIEKKDLKKETLKKTIKFLETKKEFYNLDLNLKVGKYLLDKNYDENQICSGFLQSSPKDLKKEIKENFGEEVLKILEEQEKLKNIIQKSKEEKEEVLRQVIISSLDNFDSIIIEIALKLIELKENQDKELAKKVNELYAPLANRLGLEILKKDILEESFKILNPKKYLEISNFLKMSQIEREEFVKKIIKYFEEKIKKKIKNFKIKGREKQIYSIYEKMTKRGVPLNKQRDQFAIRIILNTIEECYIVLEEINNEFPILEGTLKDYIKSPKENGYQSIHFGITFENKLLEVQIRTKEMDEFAEEGKAAHWEYKKIKGDKKFEKKTGWLKEVLKLKNKKSSIIDGLKINLFQDKIYCYTPKGKIIELKKDSTVLDFAYKIHAEVGNHAVGGIVEGVFVPLKTVLKNGETVEITTNKFQRPRRDWIKFVKTSYAKKIISRDVKRFEKIPVPRVKPIEDSKEIKLEVPVKMTEFPHHVLNFAKCCNPIPPEEIIGVLKSYKRGMIHKKGCERIKETKKHQFETKWIENFESPIKITVEGKDRPGILADLLNTISRKGFKTLEANAKISGNENAECYFILKLENLEELKEVIERVKKIEGVYKVWLD